MTPALNAFISLIPELPLDKAITWLSEQRLTERDWDTIAPHLIAQHNLSKENLAKRIYSTHSDDFTMMVKEYGFKGFLSDYLDHARIVESPPVFHFVTALVLLSATLKRKVCVDMESFVVWPPVQAMLVGPSGSRKSTAAEYGVNIIASPANEDGRLYNMLPDEGSPQGLKLALSKLYSRGQGESTGLLYVSEMSVFLGQEEYNIGMAQALADLFDSPTGERERGLTSRPGERFGKVAIAAEFCTNEAWLTSAMPIAAIGGGMIGRMLPFHSWGAQKYVFVEEIREKRELIRYERNELQESLISASFVEGEAELTSKAIACYEKRRQWYENKENWPDDEHFDPFWKRIPSHMLRIAMLASVSEDPTQRNQVKIQERHMLQGDAIVHYVAKGLPRIYSSIGTTSFGKNHQRILSILRRHRGPIADDQLGQQMANRMGRKQLAAHLDTLVRNGDVKPEMRNGKRVWKLLK